MTSPGQLLAALKAAARLAVSARLVHAVDWLFRFTQPQDWERGGRPIAGPSAAMQPRPQFHAKGLQTGFDPV
jgi:replication initiation protein RepC